MTYQFGEKDDYPISTGEAIGATVGNGMGAFSITGDFEEMSPVDGFKAFDVKNGNLAINYSFDKSVLDLPETSWIICEDTDNEIDYFEIKNDIGYGAIVVQTSIDGKRWVVDNEFTNVLTKDSQIGTGFLNTKDIQLINGCYYKITLVYEQRKKGESTDLWLVSIDNYDYRKFADVYSFYVVNKKESESSTTPDSVPRKELGEKINTGKDNGYSGNESIDKDDAHYGWSLGNFVVNGYTREVSDGSGNPVFLKNVGDRVTLWFNLQQDIDKLNGNEKLSIAEDDGGYDQFFEIARTNFKHGTLIIRFTDHEGKKTDPIIYTDYLAAHTRTSAYTKVELFEEGDYEVSLDYEIKDARGTFNYYPNYKISFKFSIRNGNCMVFPFDKATGAELNDQSITANGFKLDMAKSRYLTIDVKKSVVKKNGNMYVEDVRFDRPAKDGESYDEEGIYTFTVKNLFTSENVTKTIYVGETSIYRALAKNKVSIDEINQRLVNGEEMDDDGTLYLPVVEEIPDESDLAETNDAIESDSSNSNAYVGNPAVESAEVTTQDEKAENSGISENSGTKPMDNSVAAEDKGKTQSTNENEESSGSPIWIFVVIGVALAGGGVFGYKFLQAKKNKSDGTVTVVATEDVVNAIKEAEKTKDESSGTSDTGEENNN
ncbi:MAG: hypothetical protein MJ131_10325 [Lachnospiraceae bacterium]|nr:hypothetical protein [Lachnospiraceae bacterium]